MPTTNTSKRILCNIILGMMFVVSLMTAKSVNAMVAIAPPIAPATSTDFTTCGEITAPGTYNLLNNIDAADGEGADSGTCLTISSDGVIINGAVENLMIVGAVNASTNESGLTGFSFELSNVSIMSEMDLSGVDGSGTVTFNNAGFAAGNITGNAIFRGNSNMNMSIVNGNAEFHDTSYVGNEWGGYGSVTGTALFYDNSQLINGPMSVAYFMGSSVNYVNANFPTYFFSLAQNFGISEILPVYIPVESGSIWNNASGDGVWSNPDNWVNGEVAATSSGNVILTAPITLPSDISSLIYVRYPVTNSEVVINGAGYTVNGNIDANGWAGGGYGYSVTLSDVHVTGNVLSEGITNNAGGVGNSGNIIIQDSTVDGMISASSQSGYATNDTFDYSVGNSGNISISNSTIGGSVNSSVGGRSVNGTGGVPGSVTITDSIVIGNINTNGISTESNDIGSDGGDVTITNSSVGVITSSGSQGANISGLGGDVSISSSTTSHVYTQGAWSYACDSSGYGGSGGNISVTNNSVTGNLIANGEGFDGGCLGGFSGIVTVSDSVVGIINATGGSSGSSNYSGIPGNGGNGGNVTITNSTTTNIYTFGGLGDPNVEGGLNGIAGNIIVINSKTGALIADEAPNWGPPSTGTGGTITISYSTTGDIQSSGSNNNFSTGSSGYGGTITVESSTVGTITANGGGTSGEFLGNGGNITLTNSIVNGNIIAMTGDTYYGFQNPVNSTGGSVSLIGTTISGYINVSGGAADYYGSSAGSITLTNSTAHALFANGAGNYNVGNGGGGGVLTINYSTTTDIQALGGNFGYGTYGGGTGCTLVANFSNLEDIDCSGGSEGVNGGNGGNISLVYSSFGNITADGKDSYIAYSGNGGSGGTVQITNQSLDLSNKEISLDAGLGDSGAPNGSAGTLSLTYTSLITNTSTTFSNLSNLTQNGISYGPFSAGVFNPIIFYFNDESNSDTGHGVTGDWGDVKNWWTNGTFTTHAGRLPNKYDQVIITTSVTSNSSGIQAEVDSVVFNNSASNELTIRTSLGATFNASSSNTGNIVGPATFNGDNATNTGKVSLGNWREISGTNGHVWQALVSNSAGDKFAAVEYNGSIWTYNLEEGWIETPGTNGHAWYAITSNAAGDKLAAVDMGGSIWTYTVGGSWTEDLSTYGHNWVAITSNDSGDKLAAMEQGASIWTYTVGGSWTEDVSTNGGHNWFSITSNATGDKLAAVDMGGSIWTYTAGGSWTEVPGTSSAWVSIASNAAGDKLAAVGNNGSIWTYANGGSWTEATTTFGHDWISITSNAAGDKLAAVDRSGYIWTYNEGGVWSEASGTNGHSWVSIASNAVGDKLIAADGAIGSIWVVDEDDNAALITRVYSENATTTRDFTTEGGRNDWVIVAQGVIVDISQAIYNVATNIFKALAGGWFFTGDNPGGQVVPHITISSTTPAYVSGDDSTKTIKWLPSIDWDTSSSCQYSYTGFTTMTTVSCSHAYTGLPRPTAGEHTIYLRGTDSRGNISEQTHTYYYDNTAPVWTTCGSDLLDEATRPYYYLRNNVTGNCAISVNNMELRGASSTSTPGYTVTGNVTSTGLNPKLSNITVTGTVTAVAKSLTIENSIIGGAISTNASASGATAGNITITNSTTTSITANGANGTNGGNGGTISIATSTTGTISANGGNGTANGGNGGAITVTYSVGTTASTTVSSTGGNSTSCGWGGSGGNVTLDNSDNYIAVTTKGSDHSCPTPPAGSSGSHGGQVIVNINTPLHPYIPPYVPPVVVPTTPSTPHSSGGVSSPFTFGNPNTPLVLPVNTVKPLNLATLPVFGDTTKNKNAFTFEPIINNFLFAPITFVKNTFAGAAAFNKFLASAGIKTQQDLYSLRNKPLPLVVPAKAAEIPDGLLMVSAKGKDVPIKAAYDSEHLLVEKATVDAGTLVTVSMYPTSKTTSVYTATFNNNTYTFKKLGKTSLLSINFTAPAYTASTTNSLANTYTLKATGAPLPLVISVVQPSVEKANASTIEKVKKQSVWGVLKFWWGK